MIKVHNNYNGMVRYFKFFATMKYPNCFWYTPTTENYGFELARIDDYTPINLTWNQIKKYSTEKMDEEI